MKRLLLPIVALLTFVASAQTQSGAKADDQRAKYQVYGVAFYNLENLFDTIPNNPLGRDEEYTPAGKNKWDGRKYWSKISNLARAISNFATQTTPTGPAFIGVSEIENRSVLEDLVAAIDARLVSEGKKPWNLQIVHHDSPDNRGVDVAALYNPRMFRFVDVTNTNPEVGFKTRDIMCVTGVMGGDTLSILVNHWPSRLGGQEKSSPNREKAAAKCKQIADSLWTIRPNQGVIVMGDLNDDPSDKSCAKALGAVKKPDGVGVHQFYNPFWSILERGIGTLAYKSQWNLFDQIIVSGSLLDTKGDPSRLHYWKAQVNNFDFLKDTEGQRQNYPLRTFSGGVFLNGYSDHFPTEIFLIRQL